jgi:HSP20 family molecular chaperone IbpA
MTDDKKELENEQPKPEKDEKDKKDNEEINGVTEGALHALGRLAPGFGDIVKGLEKSEAFQERIKEANAEIERQLKKAPPLRKVEGTRKSIIPPKTTLKVSRSILDEEPTRRQQDSRDLHGGQSPQRDVIADIFDEGEYVKVIAELPGVEEKDITVEIKDNYLMISAQAMGRKFSKQLELPDAVKKEWQSSYKNGILQIRFEKEKK